MVDKIKIRAYAKLNLSLNVLDKDICGLHNIDTILINIDLHDLIEVHKRNDTNISVRYTNINKIIKNDTAKKTAQILQKNYKTPGFDIYIEKYIPFQAGLGGSSADAAGVALGIQQLFGLGNIPKDLLLRMGSDVPYMYKGGTKRVQGKGEIITDLESIKAHYAIVVCPGGVCTAQAFRLYDTIGGEHCNIAEIIHRLHHNQNATLCNSLQRAATRINKNIQVGLDCLQKAGFSQRTMSGSGSAVFGMMTDTKLFNDALATLKRITPTNYKIYCS